MSLQKKAIGGVFWTVVDTFVLKGLSFIAMIILARWLGPAEFGLVGMVAVFIAIGASLTDSGMSASLIRTKNADDKDFSTVFILNLLLSCIVYLLLFFAAPFIADFFKQPILTSVLRVYCLSFVIAAFSSVQLARLNSSMHFKKIAKLNIPGTIVGILVGLLMGYWGYGVWAIVMMYLTTQFVQSISLWLSSSWRPSMKYSKDRAKYHYGFGYKLMLSGLLNTIFQNIYNVVIGRYYSVQELGYFERSKSFNNYPVTVITSVVSKVTYPLLAGIQDDLERVSQVYRKLMRLTFFIIAPVMLGFAAIAYPLFEFVLGEEWLPAVPFFQILCLASMFYPIHAFNLNVFKVYGRSDLFLKLEIVKKALITIGLIVGFQFGVIGLVWSSVITNYIALFINTHYSADMINYSGKKQFMDMVPTFVTSGIMFGFVYLFLKLTPNLSAIFQIVIGGAIGVILYLGMNKIIKTEPLSYLILLIKKRKFT